MTDAFSSFGTLLKIGDGGGPDVYTTIAQVMDINGPNIQQRTAEVTSHDSTNGWEEHIGTILAGGEITLSLNFIPTHGTHDPTTGLLADIQSRVVRNFQMVFPDSGNTTWVIPALVVSFSPTAPVDGALTADVTLKISGEPTLV